MTRSARPRGRSSPPTSGRSRAGSTRDEAAPRPLRDALAPEPGQVAHLHQPLPHLLVHRALLRGAHVPPPAARAGGADLLVGTLLVAGDARERVLPRDLLQPRPGGLEAERSADAHQLARRIAKQALIPDHDAARGIVLAKRALDHLRPERPHARLPPDERLAAVRRHGEGPLLERPGPGAVRGQPGVDDVP